MLKYFRERRETVRGIHVRTFFLHRESSFIGCNLYAISGEYESLFSRGYILSAFQSGF